MARSGDERPAELRIGGWIPPTPDSADPTDAAVTELIPVVTEPAASDAGATVTAAGATAAGATDTQTAFPEAGTEPAGSRRWRTAVLVAVATAVTVLAAAAAPLLFDRFVNRSTPDRQVQTPPTTAPTGAAPTATPTATDATPTVPAAPGPAGGPTDDGRSEPEPSQPASRSDRPTLTPGPPPGAAAAPDVDQEFRLAIEAEGPGAVRGGRASPRPVASASGGLVVGQIGNGSANLVRFTPVATPAAGRYAVTFHYVSAESRFATIIVNGQPTGHRFPSTGSWDSVGSLTLTLTLSAGQNTITYAGGQGWAPDLDRIVVTGPPA
nr:hypothetical protein [Micromonospora sp. DSM 115978]